MEPLLEAKSIPALLVFIAVFLCANFLKGVIEFLWQLNEKKDSASEAAIKELTEVVKHNTTATEHLDRRLSELEKLLAELPKFKTDLKRMFNAVKIISGDKWMQIKEKIMNEDDDL